VDGDSLVWRLVLGVLVAGLAIINGVGVFSQLVAAHVGERGAAQSVIETQDAALAAKIEVAVDKVADLDKQLAQLDAAVATATQRGKANTGLAAVEGQRKAHAALAGEREKAASTLAALKMERAGVAAQGRRIETESAPIVYVAQLLGVGADSEQTIRWLILLMVLTCDPLAIALTAAAASRRRRHDHDRPSGAQGSPGARRGVPPVPVDDAQHLPAAASRR
jgi:hypothetical protein